jgi:hypothetical protein
MGRGVGVLLDSGTGLYGIFSGLYLLAEEMPRGRMNGMEIDLNMLDQKRYRELRERYDALARENPLIPVFEQWAQRELLTPLKDNPI